MVQSQLSAYRGSDPVWGFVALVRSELFTGEAAVGLDPRVRLYAVEGRIYFAEREDDASVATRLVNCGAVSTMQLARGTVRVAGQESLARLFQRDATIDRDAVELTIQSSTESLLASIAHNPVGMPEVFPLRHHPSGIHHWLSTPDPAIADIVADEEQADEIVAADASAAEAAVEAVLVAELPVPSLPIEEVTVAEVTVAEVTVPEIPVEAVPVADVPVAHVAVTDIPTVAPAPPALPTLPVLSAYPAPKSRVEDTIPELPRAEDDPSWAVPPDPTTRPPLAAPAPAEPVIASAVVPITAAHLPQLAPLSSIQIQPTQVDTFATAPAEVFEPPLPIAAAPKAINDPLLPKLAAGPMSVNDLKRDLKIAATAPEPWSNKPNNMAAVQIWEMVDDLFEAPKKETMSVGSGAPEARSRGWLRKKS